MVEVSSGRNSGVTGFQSILIVSYKLKKSYFLMLLYATVC